MSLTEKARIYFSTSDVEEVIETENFYVVHFGCGYPKNVNKEILFNINQDFMQWWVKLPHSTKNEYRIKYFVNNMISNFSIYQIKFCFNNIIAV